VRQPQTLSSQWTTARSEKHTFTASMSFQGHQYADVVDFRSVLRQQI
jgi:hypothetical protein